KYPIVVIIAAAGLSLAGQFAEAKPSVSGWLLAAVPALGFLALTKLILSRPTPTSEPAADADASGQQLAAPDGRITTTALPGGAPTGPPGRVDGHAIGMGVVR